MVLEATALPSSPQLLPRWYLLSRTQMLNSISFSLFTFAPFVVSKFLFRASVLPCFLVGAAFTFACQYGKELMGCVQIERAMLRTISWTSLLRYEKLLHNNNGDCCWEIILLFSTVWAKSCLRFKKQALLSKTISRYRCKNLVAVTFKSKWFLICQYVRWCV